MRKILIAVVILLSVFVIGTIALNYYLKNKIETFLSSGLPSQMNLKYDNIDVRSWEGTVTVDKIQLDIKTANDSINKAHIQTDKLSIKDLDYWDYFTRDLIHFDNIEIGESSVIYHQTEAEDTTARKEQKSPQKLDKKIQINRLKLAKTSFKIAKTGNDSTLLTVTNATFSLENLKTNKDKFAEKIPFTYENIQFETDSVFYRLNPYDNLYVANIKLQDSALTLKKVLIKTQYTRSKLSQIIPKERDHVNLNIPTISFNDIGVSSKFHKIAISASHMNIEQPELQIFRDKLVADDPTYKPLYSESLRKLPIDLMIANAQINGASIDYEEQVKPDSEAGQLTFSDLQATIKNLGNTYAQGEKTTSIHVNATFMKESPITADWSFDVQNKNDQFRFMAEVGTLPVAALNSFTEPNLNVKLTGALHKAYFDISGENLSSHINMKMNYDDFKIAVLNDEKNKKKWLISTLANLFVSKDSDESKNEYFRSGEGTAERDTTKSIFNYFWLNIKKGLVSVLIGDGETS